MQQSVTDGEWQYLKRCLPKQKQAGRPPTHAQREILNAIFYLVRTGCAWRYLPKDYPKWKTVYHYFREWRIDGLWKRINKRLRRMLRKRAGKQAQASAAILDSQSAKTMDTAREQTGYDAGKRVKGRKRHILVDTLGLLMVVVVHAAHVSETAGARLVLTQLERRFWRLRLIWLDGGYKLSLCEWVTTLERWRTLKIEQVKRSDDQQGFVILPKRWIVERTFGWLIKHRRLSKDYEALCETSEVMVYAAMIRLMLARLDAQ
ncbi:MAG: IS5 family transposase [Acidobacteria bacterium]|nr:IS5 family transposase [Acidobacteriota bacterium]